MTAETRTLCVKCSPGDYAVCVQALALLTSTTGLTKGKALAHALRDARPRPPPKPVSDRRAQTAKARAAKAAKHAAMGLDLPTVLQRIKVTAHNPRP
jgi:hypothetical protein